MNTTQQAFSMFVSVLSLLSVIAISIFWLKHRRLLAMAGNWASYMARKGGEVRTEKYRSKIKAEAKGKLVDAVVQEIPFGKQIIGNLRQTGMTDNELWLMFTDKEVLKGIGGILEYSKGFTSWFNKKLEKKDKSTRPHKMPLAT